mmetsp:Transcript_40031/g.72575  ORF Transcript_40031/g.72575 Transcript_40031/m.72575 type:complete len:274 (-) Transcript_40031:1072-1893(-)
MHSLQGGRGQHLRAVLSLSSPGHHRPRGPHGHVHQHRAQSLGEEGGPVLPEGGVVGLHPEVPAITISLVQADGHVGGSALIPRRRRIFRVAHLAEAVRQAVGHLRDYIDLDGPELLEGPRPLPGSLPPGCGDEVRQAQDGHRAWVPKFDGQDLAAAEIAHHAFLSRLVSTGDDEVEVQSPQVREVPQEGGRDGREPGHVHAAAQLLRGRVAQQPHQRRLATDEALEAGPPAYAQQPVVEDVVVGVAGGFGQRLEALQQALLQGAQGGLRLAPT